MTILGSAFVLESENKSIELAQRGMESFTCLGA